MSANAIGEALLVSVLLAPLLLSAVGLLPRWRHHTLASLPLAPLPGLAAGLSAMGGAPLTFDQAALGFSLSLDAPGALLLAVTALLWIAAGTYTCADMRGKPNAERFAVSWLLTLAGSLGVFIAADLLTFYLVFAVASIPAFGLITHNDTPSAQRAGGIYMAFTILGEAFLLMGFVLLAVGTPGGSLIIRDVIAALPDSPWRDAALAMVIAGFGTKIALVPLHMWLPPAHANAPAAASAVLSGGAVKAGIIGLINFLPLGTALPLWGEPLAILGLLTAFYAIVIGLTQQYPKLVLAYSTISQMGVVTAVIGMGLATGDKGVGLNAAFYAANHVLVKGGLFLAVGVASLTSARRLGLLVLLPASMLALSLGGLPLTGGALTKLAVKAPLGGGLIGTLATLSAAGTTLLMLHFLQLLARVTAQDLDARAPAGLALPWLAMALASALIPWLIYPVTGGHLAYALTPAALWEALWPVLIGAALTFPLRLIGPRLPSIPPGDMVVVGEAAVRASFTTVAALERADGEMRQWPAAALSLVAIAIMLGLAMLTGL